ncbi:hypothetical protein AAVH_14839 [Aphelenchoides avenae]|nr:hypothetical protein AAVH_14839 [Aphelenchus avenae]
MSTLSGNVPSALLDASEAAQAGNAPPVRELLAAESVYRWLLLQKINELEMVKSDNADLRDRLAVAERNNAVSLIEAEHLRNERSSMKLKLWNVGQQLGRIKLQRNKLRVDVQKKDALINAAVVEAKEIQADAAAAKERGNKADRMIARLWPVIDGFVIGRQNH